MSEPSVVKGVFCPKCRTGSVDCVHTGESTFYADCIVYEGMEYECLACGHTFRTNESYSLSGFCFLGEDDEFDYEVEIEGYTVDDEKIEE